MRKLAAAGFVFVGLIGPLVADEPLPPSSAGEPVVQRFLARADEPVARYRAVRYLEARNERFKMHGWLEAETELGPDGFQYRILREGGAEYIRHKVLRKLLENEDKLFATRDASMAAVTPKNYELRGSEAAEPGLVKLLVKPRRRDISLVDGAVFVTEDDADLVRVEGRLAKNPSFWTRQVDVVRRYDRIAGMRVPTALESVAQVRFAGTSTLSMRWEYESINGVAVAPASASARARPRPAETP